LFPVEHGLFILPKHGSLSSVSAIVLSVLLRFTTSDYSFSIFSQLDVGILMKLNHNQIE